MSYDIYLKIDSGGDEPATVDEVGNMTSNVAPMWSRALGHSLGELDGRVAGDVIAPLESAVAHMEDPTHRAEYEAMNPKNGWGNHEGATRYLRHLLDTCKDHPKAFISISR